MYEPQAKKTKKKNAGFGSSLLLFGRRLCTSVCEREREGEGERERHTQRNRERERGREGETEREGCVEMQTVLTHSNGVHFAASTGVPAKLATLLRRRPHLVNECDRLGHSPLSYAVLNEDIDSIKVLLGYAVPRTDRDASSTVCSAIGKDDLLIRIVLWH